MSPVTAAAAAAATDSLPEPTAPKQQSLVGRLFFPVVFLALAAWGVILATGDKVPKPEFDPTHEFDLSQAEIGGDWGAFTINKGVIYLAIGTLGSVLFAMYVYRKAAKRDRLETRPQTAVEMAYEFAYDQIAGSLPAGKLFNRYMPYVASVFIFVWFLNMTSFIPLPLNAHENIGDLDYMYAFGVYAVTSNIFATATLALLTVGIYHYEGIRAHGFVGYLKTWTAGQTGPAGAFVWVVEALTNLVLKPLSLAVRLFANMLSGHILILLMLALAGVIAGSLLVTVLAQTAGTIVAVVFYLFEAGLVASLQAFIFAVLSAIYISSAAEQHH